MASAEVKYFVDINNLNTFLIELWKIFASKVEYNTLMNLIYLPQLIL